MSNPWEQIKNPLSNYNVRRADYAHSFDFFWAKDISGNYLFLFQCDAKVRFPDDIPNLMGIDISLPTSDDNKKTIFILGLNNKEDWDIFHSLCLDLLRATFNCNGEESVVSVIIQRIRRWHLFLKNNRTKAMSEVEQKGLIGELLFLRDNLLPYYSVSESLSFWQGPLNAPQDFCIEDCAVEVKCQLGTSKPLIRISSIHQLNTQLCKLYLFVVTLSKSAGGTDNAINLPIIVNELRKNILSNQPSTCERFEDLLLQAGYIDLMEYNELYFVLSSVRFYEIRDGFPKLKPDDIPEGIVNITMDIMLDKCAQFIIDRESVIIFERLSHGRNR